MAYSVSQVYPGDSWTMEQVRGLLAEEGLILDKNLDHICCICDEDGIPIATGSCFQNTLRCFAVSKAHQGEGLLNELMSHLIQFQVERGNLHLFLYTKCRSAKYFQDLGFYEIARVEDKLVFLENRRTGFSGYLRALKESSPQTENAAAVVMNANPFTLGHQFLVEKAAAENELVHLFMVSEDASLIPFAVRKKLIQEGVAHLPNVICHESGPYIISNATFPSYFLKDEADVIEGHARLDLAVFRRIAEAAGITRRYVGEEPTSQVTGIYNQIMSRELPAAGIECIIVPRKEQEGQAISASTVRQCIQNGDWTSMAKLVPPSTLAYFRSPEAQGVIENIRRAGNVVHY